MNPYNFDYMYHWYHNLPGGAIACSWILIAISIAAMWILFNKAHEEGWAAIVPFYNTFVLFKITWGNGWLFLLLLIPIVRIVISIITMVKLAHVFGKDGGWACGLIFLNTIFLCIMAFDDKVRYIGINGEYANDYGPGEGYGGGFGGSSTTGDNNAQGGFQSQPGYQNPYGSAPKQDSFRQSSENAHYYYKETGESAQDAADRQASPDAQNTAGAQTGVKFCPSCGEKLEHGEKFCPKCGTKQ